MNIKKLNEELKKFLENYDIEVVKNLAVCPEENQSLNLYKINNEYVVMWDTDAKRYPSTSVELELSSNESDALEAFFDTDYVRNIDDYDMFVDDGYVKIKDRKFRKLAKDILGTYDEY